MRDRQAAWLCPFRKRFRHKISVISGVDGVR